MVKIKWAKNAWSLKLCQAHGKILTNVSCFVDPVIMIINFNVLCKICIILKEEGEEKKWWKRDGRKEDKWKEEQGIYIRLTVERICISPVWKGYLGLCQAIK